MAEEGKTEDMTTTKTKTGLDADVVQIGDYTFQVIVDILKDDNGSFFIIRATEITTKDVFEFKRDQKTLLSMNWPNNTLDSVKQFITSTIFDPDEEMYVQYGFVKKLEQGDEQDEKKAVEKDNVDLSKVYGEGDSMVISIALQYKWMRSNWTLDLKYVPQDEVKRLKLLVKELREELRSLKSEIKGMIVMWSGNASQIPNGWRICDGQNGTPDLRDRFILGSNGNNIGSKGGNKTHSHTISVQGHALTIAEMPSHQHGFQCGKFCDGRSNHETVATTGTRKYTENTGGGRTHSHNASSNSRSHMPPYYVLSFIMKL